MQSSHTVVWCCPTPGHESYIYDSSTELEKHIRTQHLGSFTESQLPSLIQRGTRANPDTLGIWAKKYFETVSADTPFNYCLLCHNFQTKTQTDSPGENIPPIGLRDHIVDHLETLALLSLPETEAVDNVKSNARQPGVSQRSTIQGDVELPPSTYARASVGIAHAPLARPPPLPSSPPAQTSGPGPSAPAEEDGDGNITAKDLHSTASTAYNSGVSWFIPFHELDPSKQSQCIFFTQKGTRCRWPCQESDNKRAIELHQTIITRPSESVNLDLLLEYILCNCCRSNRARHRDRIEDVGLLVPLAQRWQYEIQTKGAVRGLLFAKVTNHHQQLTFRPKDRVYVVTPLREGPFLVSSVANGRYTLCDANMRPVKNGKEFEESELELEPEDFF